MSAAPYAARAAGRLRKAPEQRSHRRYPIELDVQYRLLGKGVSDLSGSGKTRNVSSAGVLFEAPGALPAGSMIEVMLSWPFLLEGICPLRLVMRGRIVRNDMRGVAVQSTYHEFRTAGLRTSEHRPAKVLVRTK